MFNSVIVTHGWFYKYQYYNTMYTINCIIKVIYYTMYTNRCIKQVVNCTYKIKFITQVDDSI